MSSFSDELNLYEMDKYWVRIAGVTVTTDRGVRLVVSVVTPNPAFRKLRIVTRNPVIGS
jgi:hypothetical protein